MKSTFKNFWFWAFIVVILFFMWRSCKSGGVGFFGCNKGDTLSHKVDTTTTKNKDSVNISFKPTEVHDTLYYPKWYKPKEVHDTLDIADDRPPLPVTDTLKELKRLQEVELAYNKKVYYRDTLTGKNWTAVIKDTVQRNKLIGAGLNMVTICTDTTIKESTTILKHKFIVYVGVTAFGSQQNFLHGGMATLGIKGKNDMIYEAGVGKISNDKQLYYSIGVRAPIRLFKKK